MEDEDIIIILPPSNAHCSNREATAAHSFLPSSSTISSNFVDVVGTVVRGSNPFIGSEDEGSRPEMCKIVFFYSLLVKICHVL